MTKSNRPIMILLDAIGKRWALRIMWELRDGPLTFRALQQASEMKSPTTLNARLADLRTLSIVEHGDQGYVLTKKGENLAKILMELNHWADREISPHARS